MCRKGTFKFIYRSLALIMLAAGTILMPVHTFAQTSGDLPCGDADPTGTNPCPLDTWVWVLVFAAMVFGAVQLYRRQKLQARANLS